MKYLLLLAFIISAVNLSAQDMKLAGIEYLNYPKVQLKGEAKNNKASFQEFGAFVNYPALSKNKKSIFINGFQYGLVKVAIHNNILGTSNVKDFQGISYNLTVVHKWNQKWTFISRLSPGLATDFTDKLSISDFNFQGSVLALKKIKEGLSAGAGLLYTMRTGKSLLIPCAQLKYKKERNALDILLPVFISYTYQIDSKERLKVGFKVALNGANFNTGIHNLSSTTEMDRLNYSRTNIGPSISYQLMGILQIESSAGLSTMRTYQFQDMQDNTYKFNSKSGCFFKIGLAVVPPKRKP